MNDRQIQAGLLKECWRRDLGYDDLDQRCRQCGVETPSYDEWFNYCLYWDKKLDEDIGSGHGEQHLEQGGLE